eukprot:TRINITY_DN1187_c0_g1_i1.p1 TRINITY_DN1187_c0_g1~~TRINITY_DN1187_c0_g1_i1.p1  ORF type:complete len:196 (+),score=36.31 TRINITY_DN1187_c0_g1_i1:53-640(+)
MSNTVKIDVTEKASLVLLVSEARRQDIRRLQQKGLKVEGALLANVNRKWGKIKREHLAMIGRGEDGRQVRARLACLFPFLGVIQEEEIQWYRERRAETVEKANSDATSSSSPFSSEDGSDRDPSSDEEEEEEEEEDEDSDALSFDFSRLLTHPPSTTSSRQRISFSWSDAAPQQQQQPPVQQPCRGLADLVSLYN